MDLDVLVRNDLLTFLKTDSETRGATILYATHIFDGSNQFPTHVAHMRFGSFVTPPTAWPLALPNRVISQLGPSPSLYQVALLWLTEDRDFRRSLEQQGDLKKTRGPRRNETPSDSETFYKKYDYSH